eukprot:2697728-Pleurochrysis_carterae.AAC.1
MDDPSRGHKCNHGSSSRLAGRLVQLRPSLRASLCAREGDVGWPSRRSPWPFPFSSPAAASSTWKSSSRANSAGCAATRAARSPRRPSPRNPACSLSYWASAGSAPLLEVQRSASPPRGAQHTLELPLGETLGSC